MTEQAKLTVTKTGRGVRLDYGNLVFFGSKAKLEWRRSGLHHNQALFNHKK